MSKRGWILIICLAFLLGALDVTGMSLLPEPWRDFHPILDVVVLLIILPRPRAAFVFAGVSALILDAFSGSSGSFAFGRLLAVTTVIWLLSETVLTNRSIYVAGALIITARFSDLLWRWSAHVLGGSLFQWTIPLEPWSSFAVTLAWDVGSLTVAFLAVAVFTRRFLITAPRAPHGYDR